MILLTLALFGTVYASPPKKKHEKTVTLTVCTPEKCVTTTPVRCLGGRKKVK